MCKYIRCKTPLGERMAKAADGSMQSGVGYGEGCPLSSQLGGLGRVVSSRSGVQGRAPSENKCCRILKARENSFLYHYDKIWGEQLALASPYSKFWGGLASVIYAHGFDNMTVTVTNVISNQCLWQMSQSTHLTKWPCHNSCQPYKIYKVCKTWFDSITIVCETWMINSITDKNKVAS